MSENAMNLLLQIPLAGVVVLVVILFLKHLKEITAAFAEATAKQVETAAATQRDQINLFMSNIKEQRQDHIKALESITKEVHSIQDCIDQRLTEMAVTKAGERSAVRKK
jgi:hypothetical protein